MNSRTASSELAVDESKLQRRRRIIQRSALFAVFLVGLWVFVPVSIIFTGALPIADDLRVLFVPLFLLYLVWPAIAFASIIFAIRLAKLRLFPQSFLVLLIPVSILLCIVGERRIALLYPLFRISDRLHFATRKAAYDQRVRSLPHSERRLQLFVWESDPIGESGIVYDDSDQISLAPRHRSKQWNDKAANSELDGLCRAEPAGSHYYLVSFGCSRETQ